MKKFWFPITVAILLTISGVSLYYILINSVFADKVLPNVRVSGQSVSFSNQNELELDLQKKALSELPSILNVDVEGIQYSLPTEKIILGVSTDEVVDYGKGSNILKVLGQGLKLFDGEDLEYDYDINIDLFLQSFPYKLISPNPAAVVGERIVNCGNDEYNIPVDRQKLESKILTSLKDNTTLSLTIEDVAAEGADLAIVDYCKNYATDVEFINKLLYELNLESPEDIFEYYLAVDGSTKWRIKDPVQLRQLLLEFRNNNKVDPSDGEYIVRGNSALMTKSYNYGRILNVEQTLSQVQLWLDNPSQELSLVYDTVPPSILTSGLNIQDFTYLAGEGKTRMDMIRGGRPNVYLQYAEEGLREVDGVVVQPGQEFSFFNLIKPQKYGNTWRTAKGNLISGGYCNSTTTLFRAALESGLPITRRSSHTFSVFSYAWGYPLNIVDAAYYTDPKVDLSFVNDYEFPILLKFISSQPGDKFQYHTIQVYTHKDAERREIELLNWRTWNFRSERDFQGAFDRIVRVNGEVIRQDTFESTYNPELPEY